MGLSPMEAREAVLEDMLLAMASGETAPMVRYLAGEALSESALERVRPLGSREQELDKMLMLRKTIIGLCFAGFIASLFFFVWIHLSYTVSLPAGPNEKTGNVYRLLVNHGYVRYGTEQDLRNFRLAETSWPYAILLFLIAMILGLKWRIFQIRGKPAGSSAQSNLTR